MILALKPVTFNTDTIYGRKYRAEFSEKNALLRANYRELPAFDFYEYLYQGDETPKIFAIDGRTYKTARPDDLPMIAAFRSDLYVPPCEFFNGVYRRACLKKVYSLVLDLDNLSPSVVKRLLRHIEDEGAPRPSLIVNSGSGLHLYFAFDEPVDAFPLRQGILLSIQNRLSESYLGYGKMDKHPLTQSYRPVGSQTKLGDVATGFVCGDRWAVAQLAAAVGVKIRPGDWNYVKKTKSGPEPAKREKTLATVLPFKKRPDPNMKMFRYCAERIFRETDLGNRYMALFGLAVMAFKCHIKQRELIIEEMESLVECWNSQHPENPVKPSEIDKAMEGYSKRFLRVHATTLEDYFGWSFERKIPRKGRKRADHLEIARAVKDATQPIKKRQAIAKYLKQNPAATTRQIAADLGMSLSTVGKYKKLVKS